MVRGREATQFVDGTRRWVMALAGPHEVRVKLVVVITLLMLRPW
jgi:hypothetical protein